MGVFYQVICTLIACSSCFLIGIIFTWPSGTINIFSSSNTTLHRPMQEAELALFGSLSSVGALVTTPIAGYMLDVVGRKKCLIAASVSQVVAWALIGCFHQVEVILVAVFISGFAGSAFLVAPVFISEICQESIRGAMTAQSMIFYAIGMLAMYVVSGCLSYNVTVYCCLSFAVVSVVLLSLVRETPMYLMKRGDEEEAQKSIAFYRSAKISSKIVLQEMNVLRRAFNPEMDDGDASPEEVKLKPEMEKREKEKLSTWQFVKKSPSTRQAMLVCIVLLTASLFQGLVVVQVYAEPLFLEAVPTMSPTVCSVILAIITVVFGLVAAYLTDIAGRRPLLIHASIASGLCCVALGTQLQLHWAPHWVTAVLIYLFTTTYTFGAGTVPYVLVPEVFLPEVKSFFSMFCIEWAWLCNFLILFIFNPLVAAIGLGPVFYIFAAVSLLTSCFSVFYLPETKGLTVDVIQTLFIKRKGILTNG